MTVPLAAPGVENERFAAELAAAYGRVAAGGRYLLGEETEAFEREFAAYVGSTDAVGVASGTDALTLALAAAGVQAGDEVITASLTAGATAAAIIRAGAVPALAEVDAETLTLAPDAVEAAITPRTRAIVPVHLHGGAADLAAIGTIAAEHGLLVIEDCAQAAGTRLGGAHVGSGSDAAAFSFYPTKNLGGLGDGGAVVTSSPEIADRVRALRQYGWRTPQVSEELGWNSRLDELQAAFLRVKLARLDELVAERRAIAGRYDKNLDASLRAPRPPDGVRHSFHVYAIRCEHRDALTARLAAAGIGTGTHYAVPVHAQPAYAASVIAGPLRETERACSELLSLPLFPGLAEADQARVIEAVSAAGA